MTITTQMPARPRPLISLSIPVLNEQDNLDALYARLSALGERMADRCDLEFVFSDNHSSDATWSKLAELSRQDPRVRAIRFSKNFGFQRSILANYMHTRGDAIMQIDADLQDPPELLETFYEHWLAGYHVVYGVRRKRQEGAFINTFRKLGYRLIDLISDHSIPRDAGDFRLIDRRVVQALLQLKTASPYLRGMIAGLGFNQIGVDYERQARVAGESKFGMARLIRLGLTAVFNHSTVPLRLASIAGIGMLLFSIIGAIYYAALKLMQPELPRGLASIHILVLFGIGLQSLLLGIVGEYLLRIYLILRAEPVAIIENSLNISHTDLKL
jgi:glycosyltransferase involved in cell wall biosynthesis